jgi:PAS domain S-box-containing protein
MRAPHSLQFAPKDAKFLLASIVESSNDAIIRKNLDGVITSWNAGAERLFGYTAEEALGKHMSLLACPGRNSDMPYILERVKRGERTDHYEAWRCTKDQREVTVSLTVSPIRNAVGRIKEQARLLGILPPRSKPKRPCDRRKSSPCWDAWLRPSPMKSEIHSTRLRVCSS